MWFVILLLVVAVVAVAYRFRVPLLARVLGQPEERIRRQIDRKR